MPSPADGARQTEIHDQDAAGLVAHDVLRFQIAVNHAHAVSGFQRAAHLLNDLHRVFRERTFLFLDERSQVLAFDELHGDELHAIGIAQVIDADYILVGDLVGQQKLLLESRQDRRNWRPTPAGSA